MSGSSGKFRSFVIMSLKVLSLDREIVTDKMTDFIGFEVGVEDNNKNEEKDDEVSDSDVDSLTYLIHDNDEIKNDRTFYQKFAIVTTSIDDVLKEEYDKRIVDIQKIDVYNFCKTSEEKIEIDGFKGTEKRIEKLKRNSFSSLNG